MSGPIVKIVKAIAMPHGNETEYMNANTGDDRISIQNVDEGILEQKEQLLQRLAGKKQILYSVIQEIIANGNFVEFFAEEEANGQMYPILTEIGETLRKYTNSTVLRYSRVQAMRLSNESSQQRQAMVQQAKSEADMPDGFDWDSLMFKCIPTGAEQACCVLGNMFQSVTQIELGIMIEMEKTFEKTLKEVLMLERKEQESFEGYLVKDYDVLIEASVGGQLDWFRRIDVQSRGDADLMNHIMLMTPAYILGILPGAVSPGKILGSYDSVSINQLQSSIRLIAEQQVYQISVATTSPEARAGMMQSVKSKDVNAITKQTKWTPAQQASIQVKASITSQLQKSMSSINMEYNKPSKDLAHYAVGGPNTLSDGLLMETQQSSVRLHMTPLQKEILTHSLSILLACIRVRFDATRQSKIELVAQEDIDYLQVIERLAQYCEPNSQKFFTDISITLQHAMGEGHNKVRLANFGQDGPDIYEKAISTAIAKVEDIAKAVPLLNADLQEGKTRYTSLIKQILTSLAEQNRQKREISERAQRRGAMQLASNEYNQ